MGINTDLPECNQVGGMWTVPQGATSCWAPLVDKASLTPGTADDMSPHCIDRGSNLEFRLVHSVPPPAGTTYTATCEPSPNPAADCPGL